MKLSPEVKMPQFKVQDVIAEECDESAVLGSKMSHKKTELARGD